MVALLRLCTPAGLPNWVLSSTGLIVNLLISSFSIPPPPSSLALVHNVPAQPGSAQAHGTVGSQSAIQKRIGMALGWICGHFPRY